MVLLVEIGQDGFGQRRHVVETLAQRRQVDGEDVQPIVQVLAELALGGHGLQVLIGGGDQPDVHLGFTGGAQPPDLAILQHAQQLGLERERHVADFVQQQRAAVGQFETSLAGHQRAGKRALFVAEQLAFNQRPRAAPRSSWR